MHLPDGSCGAERRHSANQSGFVATGIINLNQLSLIGFVGHNAETRYLPNGTPVVKFSVATKKS